MTTKFDQLSQVLKIAKVADVKGGKKVIVSVPTLKGYKEKLVAEVGTRKNKRTNVELQAQHLVHNFVRQQLGMKGTHLQIEVLGDTGKEGLLRNAQGHFVKI